MKRKKINKNWLPQKMFFLLQGAEDTSPCALKSIGHASQGLPQPMAEFNGVQSQTQS